jgi:uncharacterized oxidoreductase
MQLTDNFILITGGGTGIGLAMAEELVRMGNTVIICGRRANKLEEAKKKMPRLHTKVCDITIRSEREELMDWTIKNFPPLNVLINNAGIQREVPFTSGVYKHDEVAKEIETNITAPIHLSALFISKLTVQPYSAIINISSGLAFTPLAVAPVYSASKAAIHSFSMSLRHQLRNTNTRVFEIIPPIVDTELDMGARERRQQADRGIKPAEFAHLAIDFIKNDVYEAAIGMAVNLYQGREEVFPMLNR